MAKKEVKQKNEHSDEENNFLTTNHGVKISDNQNSLKAGVRGSTLLEDFVLREKITHFDHERIPERVVHARGSGAHGFFQVYESMAEYTSAGFLQDPGKQTPVFVRFSTVAGSRGSADTVRDVRGFATKFYTDEGNFDLVGNNMPVFFIQDAIKFPDFVHAVKPEPHNEMPQASSAHDNLWDFISLTPESMHMIMWVMSDRALPRSYAMMEGFGVHTFRLINAQGKSRFVKFHWKPILGVHSLVWDETQKIAGKDPDFNRRGLWESIENGQFPEYELGIQVLEEEDEFKFDFDILDATKLWPEELLPVKIIGKMTLNRNPDNFFAETEQSAFHIGHIVPGIDVTNDPLLQGRLFSYLDTQLIRLGGPNFAQLPINRPHVPVKNNQRDGHMRLTVDKGKVNYEPNTLNGGNPHQATKEQGGFVSYPEKINDTKIRVRSETFSDHFSQATLFFNSQTDTEKQHIIKALRFELGKITNVDTRKRIVDLLNQVDNNLAVKVAQGIGLMAPAAEAKKEMALEKSGPLSMMNTVKNSVKTREIAIIAADGFDYNELMEVKNALTTAGAHPKIISKVLGMVKSADGKEVEVNQTYSIACSVLFDALFIPGGKQSIEALSKADDVNDFIKETYKHCKPIGLGADAVELLNMAQTKGINDNSLIKPGNKDGIVILENLKEISKFNQDFIKAIAQHRHWSREEKE